ncbi:helix-turn-helix transcriptional regulator [Actinoplanes sp. Pm04-4]|uniref:Helix-turn-helix transcriptional regulator n=1 Tax=Paractinoplanes pyxinae TaxID=2997416 RepID=A0ABT4AYY0_9ACTN|nr:helix-turn-helix transcriptional regulator [Actinoplanes pyxinae]MCY1139457.1 helix-turn-helix transcriptional regulator [Actinoplanes pyxinae]
MTGGSLREFLASRRAAITPEEAGLPASCEGRRVPGLRREEVAILAGVSVDYYVKLEQGRATNVSDQVLAAVERALRLDEQERRHLRSLVRPARGGDPQSQSRVRLPVQSMIDALPVPAIVHGPLLEILATNAAARELFRFGPARNLVRWMFTDPVARVVYLEWEKHAAQMVAILRAAEKTETSRQLVDDLTEASPDFARHWEDYRLHEHTHGVKRFFHEALGEIRVNYETMALTADSGQTVIIYSADPGSPSAEKLQNLTTTRPYERIA